MSTARPFKVLGIQQVAIGGLDKQRLKTLSGQATQVTVSPATPSTVTLRIMRRGR